MTVYNFLKVFQVFCMIKRQNADPLNEDNTFFSSITFLEGSQKITTKNCKPSQTKRQKFALLSLSKNKKGSIRTEPKQEVVEGTPEFLRTDESCKTKSVAMDDTFSNINVTQLLMSNGENSKRNTKLLCTKSKTDSTLEQKSSEFDAFRTYLNNDLERSHLTQLSQFFKSSQVIKQLDSAMSDENKFRKPRPVLKEIATKTNSKKTKPIDKLEDIFSESNREDIERFFDQIERSISVMDADVENKNENVSKFLDVLFSSQAVHEAIQNVSTNESMNGSTAETSISQINASFASALKQIFLANASKEVLSMKISNDTVIQDKAGFVETGPFYGLPLKVKELIKLYKGIEDLYNWQDECLKLPAIRERKNLIYALPTSGGKTLVAEILMLREVICHKRNALFILPFVAIVQEKVWGLSPFAVALDFLVEEYAASKGVYPPRKRRRKNSVYIATIEKALGLLNSLIENNRINEIGLIVVDELHLVGEQGRGSTLEALLTKIMFTKADIQIVGMSATIGNVADLCTFLNAEIYTQNFRPVELVEYVKCGSEVAKINCNKREEELFTVVRKVDDVYSHPYLNTIDPDRLGILVKEVIPIDSCLIFCASKKNCENVASLLCKVLSKELREYRKEEKLHVKNLLKDESGSMCKIFNVSIHYGIAYHHSGLTNEERRVIEDAFRAGIISVICCTSTLAAGVNLPAKRVILRQPYVGREFISLSKYKQMIGRAGRAGLGETGESILICDNKDLPKVKKLLIAPMDEALSSMHEVEGKGLRHLLLSCIHLSIANTRAQLQEVSKKTLLSIQSGRLGVNIKKLTDRVISDLFKLGALQEADLKKSENSPNCDISIRMETSLTNLTATSECIERSGVEKKRKIVVKNDTKLVISKLGCAAIKGNFELTKAHMLYDDLHEAQRSLVLLDSLHLLYLVTPYEIADQIKPNKNDYYHIYCHLSADQLQTARILGIDDSVALKMLSNQPIKTVSERVLSRFYLTLMLHDLWNEHPVFEVSEKYQISRGVVQNLMTSAASFASNVVYFCEGLEEFWTFAHLLKGMSQRLSHCCVRELLPLMELPAVKQSRAKQLYNAGYTSLQSIAKANVETLVESIEFMPRRVAKQLIAAAKMLLLEKVENLREEAEDVMDGVENAQSFIN